MEISGVDEKGQITGLITVSQYQTDVGQDYVIAHALGHMVLHHVLQGVTAPMTCICAQESEQVESQAQRFARGLLIPHSALQTIIERQRISDRQTLIHEIMKAFHVSMTVASQRTIDIGWATRMLPAMPSPHHDATRIMNPTEWRADPHGTASLA
jgi:Zn-dependent peptidase ImmA (M78 family)